MNLASEFFITILAFKAFAESCSSSSVPDLTFYISSSINDTITCSTRNPVNAVISPKNINGPPALPSIWDSTTDINVYHCLLTKYFFVPGRPTSVIFDGFADDYLTLIINNFQVSEISSTEICKLQSNKDVSRYVKPGLNQLFIDAYNAGGAGYFGYRLTINIQLD